MKRLLSNPVTNAVGLSVFSAFYATILLLTARGQGAGVFLTGTAPESFRGFWFRWAEFLADGGCTWLAVATLAVTVAVVFALLRRRRAYDEYHTGYLLNSLAVAAVLTLFCIAAFALLVAVDPYLLGVKFMLFITVHWVTVVLADAAYVFLCGR